MTSATGRKRPAVSGAGFTLVEILLVLALMGLLAGLGIAAAGSLFGGLSSRSSDVFWDAVLAARSQAVTAGAPARLRVAEDGHSLQLESTGAAQVFSLTTGTAARIVHIGFPAGSELSAETDPAGTPRSILFYPDGTCDAFQLELTHPPGSPSKLAVDPWTCAAMSESSSRS